MSLKVIKNYPLMVQKRMSLTFFLYIQELGDVRNWAEVMEHDMKTVMSTLEFVHQGKEKKIK